MKSNIIALTQKDLHKLGDGLGGVCLGYNCYLYENDIKTHETLCKALGYSPESVKYYSCYQVAYCCNAYGNSGQLHRVELKLLKKHKNLIFLNKKKLALNMSHKVDLAQA